MVAVTDAGGGYDVDISGGSGHVVGDYAHVVQVFLNGPAPLATRVRTREFGTLVRERTRTFVGREFVFDAIREALDDEGFRSGYVVLRGEPGIGKTAIVAQLVKDLACVHHFNIAPLGIRSAEAFLANVCAQLILRYGLDYASLPPEATKDGGFLAGLLEEVASVPANLPVVVAVDALDESEDAGAATGANRLFLPPHLPDRVYFVVSARDGADSGLYVDARRDIDLRDDDARNVDDVRTYVRQYVDTNRDRMTPRIEQWAIPEDEFVSVLTQKSAGNFMYLVHVLRDIRDGVLNSSTVDDIRKLPRGLRPQAHPRRVRRTRCIPGTLWAVFAARGAEQRIQRVLAVPGHSDLIHAAHHLGIRKAVLTRQIDDLERTVGATLLDKTSDPDGISPHRRRRRIQGGSSPSSGRARRYGQRRRGDDGEPATSTLSNHDTVTGFRTCCTHEYLPAALPGTSIIPFPHAITVPPLEASPSGRLPTSRYSFLATNGT
jgi:hypothetical protein